MTVNSAPSHSKLKASGRLDWFLDLGFAALLVFYLSGGGFLLNESLRELIGQKPWIHRLFSTASLLGCYFLYCLHGNRKSPLLELTGLARLSSGRQLWLLFLAFGLTMTWVSCVRHQVFRTSFDMAIFTQAVWSVTQGQLLFSSIKGGICLLADHFSPLLLPLALPYFVWPNPQTILFVQAFAAASSVFAVYRLAEFRLKEHGWAMTFAAAFVLYLPVRNSIRFDFHPEIIAIPLLIWAFYYLEKGRLWLTSLLLLGALASKENAALVTFGIGLYAFLFRPGKRLFGLGWMCFSFAYLMFIIYWLIPAAFDSEYIYIGGNYLSWKDRGVLELAQHLLRKEALVYLIKIFAPLGFLSIMWPPAFMLTMPTLLQNLATGIEAHTSVFFQYTAYLTPFVFISAIYGAALLKKWLKPGVVLFFSLLMAGVSEFYIGQQYLAQDLPHAGEIQSFAANLDPAYSVRTHEALAPHFANRPGLHIFENNHPLEGGSEKALTADYTVLEASLLQDPAAAASELTERGYVRDENYPSFYVFRREEIGHDSI